MIMYQSSSCLSHEVEVPAKKEVRIFSSVAKNIHTWKTFFVRTMSEVPPDYAGLLLFELHSFSYSLTVMEIVFHK